MLSVVFILAALVILVNYDSAEPTSIRQRSEDVRSLTLDLPPWPNAPGAGI